ncbi:MAG: tripartite tricarboxylate transporter substrate binding protein [Burkholderiaceae bacterium]|nr:tripartite tricarboxylate transporter substrate binding protein [Burkholderiaceae bacterium]
MQSNRARRRVLLAALGAGTLAAPAALLPRAARAQSKTLRWIVPYPAGGGSDFLARTVGAQLSQLLGHSVVIDNRPGAATAIGAQELQRAAADGQTVMSADNATLVFNAALYSKLTYDPAQLAPVGLMARFPLILVAHPAAGWSSARDLVAAARKAPGALSYASVGAGSPHHLAFELFKDRSRTFIVHIPYRGAAPAVQDVLGNQVPTMFIDTAVGLPHIRAGRLRPLAVATSARLAALPEVPTLAEQGVADVEVFAWQGLVVPAATPREVVARLSAELGKALAAPEVANKLVDFGLEVTPGGPDAMAEFTRREIARWHALIRARGLRLD